MTRLSDIAAINPTRKVRKGALVPFIEMAALPVSGRDISSSTVEMRIAKSSGAHFQNGDTLFARITPCLENGKTAQVRALPDSVIGEGSTEFVVLCGHDSADNDFVYYLCRDPKFRSFAISRMEGTSGRQRVAWQSIAGYELALPQPEVRRAAAEILATLDDRINNLHQTNATLEAMARALFKSWFVDFDGVPPEDMQESELGLIPKGWRVGTIGECFSLTMGQSPPGKTYNDEGIGLPFFQGRTDFGFRYPGNRKFCSKPNRIANPGDTLVSVRAPVGDLNMAWETCCIGRGVAAIRHRSGSRSFTYYAMHTVQKKLQQFEHAGTVFGSINKMEFEKLVCIEPPASCIEAYEEHIKPFDDAIKNNIAQSRTLTQLRDTLLPKLIYGELPVSALTMSEEPS